MNSMEEDIAYLKVRDYCKKQGINFVEFLRGYRAIVGNRELTMGEALIQLEAIHIGKESKS